jgi:hypothetical protein
MKPSGSGGWSLNAIQVQKSTLESVSKPGRETAPGFSLDGRQRWGAQQIFLGMPNTTMRGATCDFCATCDFWTLKRDSCIKRYPSGVCPSPARETTLGFSLRGRGAPQKRLGFFGGLTRGPQTQAFSGRRLPAPQRSGGECPNFGKAKSEIRPAGRRARATARRARCRTCSFRGGAEHACCRACYVPVRGPAGFAFYQPVQKGDEGSL